MAKHVAQKRRARSADETPVRAVRLSDALIEKIDAWAAGRTGYGTRSDAIRDLIEHGLAAAPAPRKAKAGK
jgi:metal-responsive CopG/Arc/MetJ family transcriptional regulator